MSLTRLATALTAVRRFGVGHRYALEAINSAPFSAMAKTVAFVLAAGRSGITEASTTRRPSTPFTRRSASVTASTPTPSGDTSRAVFGDILGEICVANGIAGVVIDGATRDVDELTAMKLPVFATAVTPAGPWKNGPGTVGYPVACGHVVCHPGDAIFGDGDGVVVVARDEVAAIAAATEKQDATEEALRVNIRQAFSQ